MTAELRTGGGLERTLPREAYLAPEYLRAGEGADLLPRVVLRRPRGGAGRAGRLRGEGRRGREHPRRADAGRRPRRRTTTSAATAARSSCPTAARAALPAASAAPTTRGPTRSRASSGPRRSWRSPTGSRGASLSLHPVGVDTWGGFVFVQLTPDDAEARERTLAAQLGGVPERLRRYPLAELRVARRITYEVQANWKVMLENYNECYHCGPGAPRALPARARVQAARRLRARLGARHPASRGRLDLHRQRHHQPAAVRGARRRRARSATRAS